MYLKKKLTLGIRMTALIADHSILLLVLFSELVVFLVMRFVHSRVQTPWSLVSEYYFALFGVLMVFVLYLNKDFFDGRSPAKRFIGIKVVDKRTNETANPLRCLIRNITLVVFPVEAVFILINPERRLGDYLAGTKLEYSNQDGSEKKRQNGYFIHSMIIALLMCLLSWPFFHLVNTLKNEGNIRDPKYYNKETSTELNEFLSDRLKPYGKLNYVWYYEKTKSDSLKLVSLELEINDRKYIDNSDQYTKLMKIIEDNLNAKVEKESYILNGKFINKVTRYPYTKVLTYNTRSQSFMDYNNDASYINDSTKVIKTYYKSGKPESETIYIHEVLSGTYRDWYEDGKIKTEIPYVDGKMEGIMTTWYENGQKETQLLYENNTFVRYTGKWDKQGNPLPLDN